MEAQLIISITGSVLTLLMLFALHYYQNYKYTKKVNDRLTVERNNFETISKKANDIIFVIDIVTGQIYNANLQASEMLGYSLDEFKNKTIHDLHPEELLNLSAETIAKVWENKGMVYQNLPFVKRNKERIDVESSAVVQVYDDKPVIILYARDIRQRLKMEREIREKSARLEEKNKDITDSITYARRIQRAVLGDTKQLKTHFEDAFIFLRPHSIVSGDFYWFRKREQHTVVIAADCTGHGVPGAFMTLLGNNFLDEIIDIQKTVMPDKILQKLDSRIIESLSKQESKAAVNDGMDMAVLTFCREEKKVYYAGAKNPLFYIKDDEPRLIKASKFPIGGRMEKKQFERHELDLQPDTTFYIYSDGFQDQFGGEKNRKFMSKRFRRLLHEISQHDMEKQNLVLGNILDKWMGKIEQTDDVLVIGVKT